MQMCCQSCSQASAAQMAQHSPSAGDSASQCPVLRPQIPRPLAPGGHSRDLPPRSAAPAPACEERRISHGGVDRTGEACGTVTERIVRSKNG